MQRPFGCAQAPDICNLACVFAASAGDNDATASAPATIIFTIEQRRMKSLPKYAREGSSHNRVTSTSCSRWKRLPTQISEKTRAMKLPDPPLLLVTDRRQARRALTEIVGSALAAGCRWVSLREKDLPEDEQVLLARTLLTMTRRHDARLVLHGEAALAKLAGLDGVHLPSGSDPAAARKLLGPGKLIGLSIHTAPEAASIDPAFTDYAIAGPAFETPSKPGYGPEIGRKGLREMAAAARVPVLAIGGINSARVGEVIASGCAGIAVMGGIMRAADPPLEVKALTASLNGALATKA
jgi:thiamine-phosphate pyrophosphorylase